MKKNAIILTVLVILSLTSFLFYKQFAENKNVNEDAGDSKIETSEPADSSVVKFENGMVTPVTPPALPTDEMEYKKEASGDPEQIVEPNGELPQIAPLPILLEAQNEGSESSPGTPSGSDTTANGDISFPAPPTLVE